MKWKDKMQIDAHVPKCAESTVCLKTPPEDADLAGWDGPGWYFYDEAYQLHGPFGSKEEVNSALSRYCAELVGEA